MEITTLASGQVPTLHFWKEHHCIWNVYNVCKMWKYVGEKVMHAAFYKIGYVYECVLGSHAHIFVFLFITPSKILPRHNPFSHLGNIVTLLLGEHPEMVPQENRMVSMIRETRFQVKCSLIFMDILK